MMHLLLEALPLPPHRHAQVLALWEEQDKFRDDLYEAMRNKDEWGRKVGCAAYNARTAELQAILGPDAHASFVDPDLWGGFSDLHKDYYGFRPRCHMTLQECSAEYDRLVAIVNAPDFKWPDEEMA